jgi:hypothetical protein
VPPLWGGEVSTAHRQAWVLSSMVHPQTEREELMCNSAPTPFLSSSISKPIGRLKCVTRESQGKGETPRNGVRPSPSMQASFV